MTAQVVALPSPLKAGVEQLEAALRGMPIGGWDGLDELVVRDLASRMMRLTSMMTAHQAAATRVLDESGLARRSGASSTGALLAGDFGGDRAAGDRMVRTGQLLSRAGKVEEALASGRLTERAAKTIATAVDDVPAEHKDRCSDRLIADAQRLTPKDLERRALRVTDVFKPPAEVDADENARLEDRERRAWAKTDFSMWDNRDGTHSGRFTIPEAQADKLRAALEHLAAPRRDHLSDAPSTDRMGRGFAELADRLSSETLMGSNPVAIVTIDQATLLDSIKPATLSTGTRISAGEARLTACKSDLIPAVLGGKSQVLDLGRAQRLFTKAQKIAMGLRDRGCAHPDCDRPPEWCEAHHLTPWAKGGRTDIDDGVLLCAFHHREVHARGWSLRRADDGIIEFRGPRSTEWQRNRRFRISWSAGAQWLGE